MMLLQYPFALSALALCLLLTGVLSFFGYHVVRRGVIFVDLALAQVASLGACVGIAMGLGEDHPLENFLLSLAFTLLGALLFSWFRGRRTLPIEALIGVTYAGAMAFSLIVLEKSATGSEELKEMLVGSILTISPQTLGLAAGLFALVGVVLFFARKALFQITEHPEEARRQGRRIWIWDFLFYTAFGIVVTFSVRMAGVLLVFAFLIVPSLASILMVPGTWRRVAFGWGFGTVGCIVGLEASLRLDWSAGPTMVAAFILLLIVTGVLAKLRRG
ncbi:MAG: metal ABC transporter permease [Fibrobacterota bacterium]|nr:metal ABC transporter permease [Fibrobacterota bacterium]